MTKSRTKTHGTVVGEESLRDDQFRKEWERLELARALAATIVAYRSDRGLSQRDLAQTLGVPQSQVARLENGTVNPSSRTLMRLAGQLGIEFNISIAPENQTPKLVTRTARATVVSTESRSSMRFAASGA